MTTKTKKLCAAALFMALVCIATLFFKVPIPMGYAHLGNGFILLGCFYMGNPYAIAIGGVGSCLADLLGGFPEWILPTLLIKSIMGFCMAFFCGKHKLFSFSTVIGCVISILVMIFGYFIAGIFLQGSAVASAAQFPGLISEGFVGIILFYILSAGLEKVNFSKLLDLH